MCVGSLEDERTCLHPAAGVPCRVARLGWQVAHRGWGCDVVRGILSLRGWMVAADTSLVVGLCRRRLWVRPADLSFKKSCGCIY